MTRCGQSLFTCGTYPQPEALGNRGFIQGRRTKMMGSEHVGVGPELDDWRAFCPIDSLSLSVGSPTANSATAELPLRNYLYARRKLTYEEVYFPVGYPVRILSNSPDVLAAAAHSWGTFHPVFHREPLEVLIEVRPDKDKNHRLPPAPAHMVKGPLLIEVAD